MRDAPGGSPLQGNCELAHVAGIAGTKWTSGDAHRSPIDSALRIRRGLGIVNIGKVSGDKTALGHLRPIVKADGFQFLEHDLGGSGVLPGQLHHEQAVVNRADDPRSRDGDENSGDDNFNDCAGALDLLGATDVHYTASVCPTRVLAGEGSKRLAN